MMWREFRNMNINPGEDVACLDYGKAWIPEEDAIELGKKYAEMYAETWGYAGFVVVPGWKKLFWKRTVTKLIPERPGLCHSWISYCSDCSGTRLASTQNLEPHRPVFHFTPGRMWMNDPNGMFYKDGEFHLYYQHNPFKNSMDPMHCHWGHATTSDLLHWRRQPVALFPDNLGCMFSGSCIVDAENTSGFGNGAVVAFFTHHSENGHESQSIAHSVDGGMTFKKFPGNPVIPRERDFRDPKVFWDRISKRWIMAVASPQAENSIRFYGSGDVKTWTFLSAFEAGAGATAGKWECPELLYFADHNCHLLIVSVNTGGPNGGSGTQYFIGRWEERGDTWAFTRDLPPAGGDPLWLDHGPDNYAGVTWSNHGNGTYHRMIGWMSNWKYATHAPTEKWRSAMTLPRDLRLIETPRGLRLSTTLPPEVIDFFQEPANPDESTILVGLFKLDVKTDATHNNGTVIEFSSKAGDILAVTCDANHARISIDRSGCGAFDFGDARGDEQMPPSALTAPWHASPDERDSVMIVLDRASIELFADGGQTVMTATFFPQSDLNKVVVKGVDADMTYFPYTCSGEDGTDDVAFARAR